MRDELEAPWLADSVRALAPFGKDHRVLDLGCGGGLGPLINTPGLGTYVGVDFRTPDFVLPGEHVLHDLRDGLGPVGDTPFDLYVAGFGLASHLAPGQLRRVLGDIARHARPGALVAVEALGLFSLEWPRLWDTVPGHGRTLSYALEHDVEVHPWAPAELTRLLESAGIRPLHMLDRSIQTGPKLCDGRYWPGLPALRPALVGLWEGEAPAPALTATLPPLPAGAAAAAHQRLAARRRAVVTNPVNDPAELAHAIWALEHGSGGGFGHGLLAVGRVA
ncbi:MAG: hypothetical protein ACR2HC_05585 [Thermoleophilaceae bacterium]